MTENKSRVLRGQGVAAGIGIGRAICVAGPKAEVYRLPIEEAGVEAEIERLRDAVRRAQHELDVTQEKAGRELGPELAEIFEAHTLMLDDRAFLGRIEERIRSEHVNAEWSVHQTTQELEKRFEGLDDPTYQARIEDLLDVAQYLLRFLTGGERSVLGDLDEDVIVVADDLTPSDAVRLGRERVLGFALENGGPTSHTTIIARSLHLPLVTGLKGVLEVVQGEDRVIVDGYSGDLLIDPTPEVEQEYAARRQKIELEEKAQTEASRAAAVTLDGVRIELLANIDLPEEIQEAVDFGAEGIGLYRSEFLYIERSPDLPSEQEHLQIFRQLLEAVKPHPVTIRTFDLGGRKLAREVLETREANPVLGLRGIRLTLAKPEIFRLQVRALLRASGDGDLRIMIPMVSTVEEVQQFKAMIDEVSAELEAEGFAPCCPFKLGVMIEVPSAALNAAALAREVDFFSIGTNDLVQYSLAVDRNNEHVSYLYRPVDPAILRLIDMTLEAAEAAGIEVSICGEMAADPRYLPLLLGLGLRKFSVSPRAIPELKRSIASIELREWKEIAKHCLTLGTADEVLDVIDRPQLSEEIAS